MYESLALEHSSTVDRVAGELRRAMFAGELEPGTPLREVALADSLGVARSTVREAMALLASEQLVTRLPNRGVVVTDLDPDALGDVFRARTVLEEAGARAWAEASPDLRDAARTAMAGYARLAESGAAPERIARAHTDLHRAIAALAGSERLAALADALHGEIRLTLSHVERARGNVLQQVAVHQALLDRLERGETDEVVGELREHLGGARESLGDALRASATMRG